MHFDELTNDAHLLFDPGKLTKKSLDLIKKLNPYIQRRKLKTLIEHVYVESFDILNPYHNVHHLYEVLHFITMMMELMPMQRFGPSEKTLIQIAALFHDYKHFGKSNKDWNNDDKSNESVEYSVDSFTGILTNDAFNEHMHYSRAIAIILEYKTSLFPELSDIYVCEVVRTLILSTNMANHDLYMNQIAANSNKINDMILLIKLADVSHPLRAFHVHLYWVYKNYNECADALLKIENIKPSITYIANDTLYFINTFLKPLVDIFTTRYKRSEVIKNRLQTNINKWNQILVYNNSDGQNIVHPSESAL